MKFSVKVNIFVKSLENVYGIVEKSNTNPILSNVRISTENNKLILNTTNTEIDIIETVETESITEEGATTVSAKMLYETIKKLPATSTVTLSYKNDAIVMLCDKFKGNLGTLAIKDFPSLHTDELPHKLTVEVEKLKTIINKTRFSVATDDSRFYLNGIYFHTIESNNQHVLRAVSTDSHRLSLSEIPCETSFELSKGIILPKKTADELFKLLTKTTDEKINIELSATRASFRFSNLQLTSKLINADYPNYPTVIPYSNKDKTEIDRKIFMNAIDLISTYTDTHKTVILEFKDSEVLIKSQSKENGSGELSLQLNNPFLESLIVGFNAKYVKDACEQIETDTIVLNLSTSGGPALLTAQGNDAELFVIMPIRL